MINKKYNTNNQRKNQLTTSGIRQDALRWWNGLTKGQQQDFEFKSYGYGDPFEDNSLSEEDYIHMYKKWVLDNI